MTHRHQIVAALAILMGANREEIMRHLSSEEASHVGEAFSFLEKQQGTRESGARKHLHLLMAHQEFHGLAEIHPAWLLEELEGESPRVIGVILRYLPSRHVRFLLERLPLEVKSRLPEMVEVFSVPTALVEVIRKKFEARFLPMRFSHHADRFTFEDLASLKSEDLETLFADLGMQEMAIALSHVHSKPLRMVLNRFPLKEAKQLQLRIREVQAVSTELKHQAQFLVINIACEFVGAKKLLLDLGISAFARALQNEDHFLIRMIQQKLKPEYGYILKRAVAEWSDQRDPKLLRERRNMVEERLIALSALHQIDASFSERLEEMTKTESQRKGFASSAAV